MKINSASSRLGAKFLTILILLALLASSLPQPVLAQSSTCAKTYTVVAGDTLSKIALAFDVTVAQIAAANNLKEPYTIFVGQVLCIPGTSSSGSSASSSSSKKPTITITPTTKGFIVKADNFPQKSTYFVRVGSGRVRDNLWYRVGRVRVGKTGTAQQVINLPRNLLKVEYMTICLKNVVTDAVMCKFTAYTPATRR